MSEPWRKNKMNSLAYILLMFSILVTGLTWSKVEALFSIMDIHAGSKTTFMSTFEPQLEAAVKEVLQNFIMDCRKQTQNPNDTYVIIDAGWSHAGWWARECTVTAIDGYSGLPIAVYNVMRGKNYTGSSRGMEGFGVMKIMESLKGAGFTVTKVLHDKDASTMKNVQEVFQDVKEALCVSM